MKSLRKKILASALAVTLVGGMFAPMASAVGPVVEAKPEQIWKDLKITKILNKVEKGVTTPKAEFEFSFTSKTEDAPAIENVKIGYTATDDTDADVAEAGVQVEKTVGVDLSKIQWEKAGIYEYELQEFIPSDENKIKDMDYGYLLNFKGRYTKPGQKNTTPYIIKFKVEEKEGKLEVTGITVFNQYDKFKGKLNYDSEKGLKFKNNYDKKDGNTPVPGGGTDITDADKKGFAFKKNVSNGTEEDNKKEFDFTVQVDKAVGSKSKDTDFKYVIVDENGNVGGQQTGAYNTPVTIKLKHNERVVFTDVILGSKVTLTETDSKGLTTSIEGSLLDKQINGGSITGIIGDNNGGNFAEVTNAAIPLTGVLIDNLPYIALVAVAGLGIFFFVKNRREEEIYA